MQNEKADIFSFARLHHPGQCQAVVSVASGSRPEIAPFRSALRVNGILIPCLAADSIIHFYNSRVSNHGIIFDIDTEMGNHIIVIVSIVIKSRKVFKVRDLFLIAGILRAADFFQLFVKEEIF